MNSDNFTPTFINAPANSYRPRPIFTNSSHTALLSSNLYSFVPISKSPPPSINEVYKEPHQPMIPQEPSKEIIKLSLRIKILEKEKSLEERERVSLTDLVNKLKTHNKNLEEQLKCKLIKPGSEETNVLDQEVMARLHEQEDLFQKKERLFEDERNQLLKVLAAKDSLIKEIQEDKQKEYEFELNNLKEQLDEKQNTIDQLNENNNDLRQTIEELKENFMKEKEEAFFNFEAQRENLEEKFSIFLQENQKVVIFNNGLLNEVEGLRNMNKGLEEKHASHLEEIKNKFYGQLENNKTNLKSNFEIEKNSLENEIADLKSYSEKMKERFDDILLENQSLRAEKEDIENDANHRVSEIEEKILILLEKNQDLLNLIEANNCEIEGLKRDFKKISNENFDYLQKFKEDSEKAIFSGQALEKKETQYLIEIEELKSNKLKLESHLQDLEHKILDLLTDNEKLNTVLLDQIKENELLKISVTNNKVLIKKNDELHQNLEASNQRIRGMEEKFEQLFTENAKLNAVFEKTHKDYETSKAHINILENELESKLKVFCSKLIIFLKSFIKFSL